MILNGSVEIVQKGRAPVTKHLGDSFGVNTTPGSVYNKGIMRTRVDDCQVGLVALFTASEFRKPQVYFAVYLIAVSCLSDWAIM